MKGYPPQQGMPNPSLELQFLNKAIHHNKVYLLNNSHHRACHKVYKVVLTLDSY